MNQTNKSKTAVPGRLARLMLALAAVSLLAACGAGEMTRREGMSLIKEGKVDQGLAKLEQAMREDPNSPDINRDYLRQRDLQLTRLLTAADNERVAEHYDAADAIYRQALALDPRNDAARDGLAKIDTARRHDKLLNEAEALAKKGDVDAAKSRVGLVLIENPDNVRANQLRYKLEEAALAENVGGPTLNIKGRKPVTLQFRDANLKLVLEALSRTTGINILLDKDVRSDLKVTIFVKDTPVEETLDLILMQNQLEKRVLGENTVLVYPFNPAKIKDYQELKVRRFSLTNADPKQVQTMIKTILKTRDIYVDEKTNAVVIRDTPQAIRVAERLVAAMDQADAEVMLEVKVLEIDRNWALDLGLNWPTNWGWSLPAGTLNQFKHRNGDTIQVPAIGISAVAQEQDNNNQNTLASPRIRVRNKEKAKILIGDRLPVVSSAATPAATATGTTGAVYNTSIQYLETGIKLEVEPTIHSDGDVAIKTNLEVSTPGPAQTNATNGSVYYAVSTRNITTVLQLKDGETAVFGGLIQNSDKDSGTKVPGLGDIPIFGRLFGAHHNETNKTEVVLSITPHIVRNNTVSEADLLELWSGTESDIKFGAPNLKASGTSGVVGAAGGAAPTPRIPTPVLPAPRPNGATAPGQPAPAAPGAGPSAAAAGAALGVALVGPQQARVGDRINVVVNAQGASRVNAVTFALNYDSTALKAIAVNEGDFMRRAGIKAAFDGHIDEAGGTVNGSLTADSGTASGAGGVAVVQFEVIGPTPQATVSLGSISASGIGGTAISVPTPPPLSMAVKPLQ